MAWKETHIQHAVGFVEHQNFQVAQVGQLAGHQVLQASRSGDHQSSTGAKAGYLRLLGHAADDQRRFGRGFTAKLFVLPVDLHGQLARRQQNQRAGVASFFALQHFDDRNQKRQRLAAAGLRGADYVLAFKGGSNRARLDRG